MNQALQTQVEAALRDLTPVWEDEGRLFLSVPVRYSSGALAALEVNVGKDLCWVSDKGFGLLEAEMCGAEGSFQSAARVEAARHGVGFDGQAVFAASVPMEHLAWAITAIANASCAAAAEAIRSAAARKANDMNEAIFDRLSHVFPGHQLARNMLITGDRIEWKAHNVLSIGDRRAVFEGVMPNAGSISAKFLMFSDLGKRPNLVLNAVVDDAGQLGEKGLMLQDVANIIEARAPAEQFRQAA